jgi:hypothetical protein
MSSREKKTLKKPRKPAAAAAAAPALSDERAHSDDEREVQVTPDVMELRNAIPDSLVKGFDHLLSMNCHTTEGAKGVAFRLFSGLVRKAMNRVLGEGKSMEELMQGYGDMTPFLAECDKLGVIAESAVFPSSRGPDLARRLGHVAVGCVPRSEEGRTRDLFAEISKALQDLTREPGNAGLRGYLVLLAPEIWNDADLDVIARGVPRVRPQGIGKQMVRRGTMRLVELPGGIQLDVTDTFVRVRIRVIDEGAKRNKRKKQTDLPFVLTNERTDLIFEQIARLTRGQSLLEQAAARLELAAPDEKTLADQLRAADSPSLMLDVLVANDAFLLIVFLAVFATAAPLDLEWEDEAHAVAANGGAFNRFVSFASLALHCTATPIFTIANAVMELAPKLICSNVIKSDIFESNDNLKGLQLALCTVGFYLAMHNVSTYFHEIAGNMMHSSRLMPLTLMALMPINAADVYGNADQPTNLLPHPSFKSLGPGTVTILDIVLHGFATNPNYPAALVFAVRRMVPWRGNELMVPGNIDPRVVVGMTDELFEQDPALAAVALSAWFSMLTAPPYYRNKPTDQSPIRDLVAAHRADQNGMFDGTSGVFAKLCTPPATIDPLFYISYAAANLSLRADDDRSSAFGTALLCDFVAKHVDDQGNLVHMSWEDGPAPAESRKRKRASSSNDDDDDDDGRMTAKTSATSRSRKSVKRSPADTARRPKPAKRARAADDDDDDDDDDAPLTKAAVQKMLQESLAAFLANRV